MENSFEISPYLIDTIKVVFTILIWKGLEYVLKFRKQNQEISTAQSTDNRDEFQLLRDTFRAEFERQNIRIAELENEVKKLKNEHQEEIDRRVKAEQALITTGVMLNELYESIEALKLVDNNLPAPKWVKNKELKMIDLNDAYERMFLTPHGKSKKDYIGHSDIDVWGKEIGKAYQKNDSEVIRKRDLIKTYEEHIMPNGQTQKLWVMKWPIFSDVDVVGVKGMCIPLPSNFPKPEKA